MAHTFTHVTFDSVAGFRAFPGSVLFNGETIFIAGSVSMLDGSPGIYTFDSNSSATDDGVLVLQTTDTVGNGRAIRQTWFDKQTIPAAGSNNIASYAAGTAYSLTTTSAKVTFGTTSPAVTINQAGTYMIYTNLKIEYAGLTTALNACNFKLRRTNNTAADLPNAATTYNVPVATLLTGTGGDVDIAVIIYTTANSTDQVELWANRQNGLTITGNINVTEASIVAIRLS